MAGNVNVHEALAPLKMLMMDGQLGAATKLAYHHLWMLADCRPDYVIISPGELARACGRDTRAARKWLVNLCEADLIEIVETDRRGVHHIYVYHPLPGRREARPDPQIPLPLEPSPPAEEADLSARKGPDLTAPKGPREEEAAERADVTAPKGPRSSGEVPKGPDLTAPKGPSCALQEQEQENKKYLPQEQRQPNQDIQGAMEPAPIGTVVGAIVDAAGDQAARHRRKEELVRRMRAVVADPDTNLEFYWKVASMHVDHGVSLDLLDECLDRVRQAKTDDTIKTTPGRYFFGMIQRNRRYPPEILGRVGIGLRAKQRSPPGRKFEG